MDPNFIQLDWERTLDALSITSIMAIVIERALSMLFDSSFYIERHKDGLKEAIAFAVSAAACAYWQFDVISMILLTKSATTVPGYLVTGALVAGGSKGSVKLFEDLLNWQGTAAKARDALLASRAADEAEEASKEAQKAGTKEAAHAARNKAATAVRKAKDVAIKATAKGKSIAPEILARAETALQKADAVVDAMPKP